MISPFDTVRDATAGLIRSRAVYAVLGWYLLASAVLHTAWEIAHLPLYTLWTTGSLARQTYSIIHCTLGDVLIAAWTLAAAVLIMRWWPAGKWKAVAVGVALVVLGVAYTAFSEWWNVYVEGGWSYSTWMPTVTIAGHAIGVSPLLQWVVVPPLALWFALGRGQRGGGDI